MSTSRSDKLYSCWVPAGLGMADLVLQWAAPPATKGGGIWRMPRAFSYPTPRVFDIGAGLLSTKGGDAVTVRGSGLGGGVVGGISTMREAGGVGGDGRASEVLYTTCIP